jgi:plastocyanin
MSHCNCQRNNFIISRQQSNNVVIPNEDRFVPFGLTIHAGETVTWTNNNSDNHTVVSDDAINTIGPHIDQIIPVGKQFSLRFNEVGQWVYYCRFHSHLDAFGQPIAPGCGEEGDEIEGIVTPVFQCGDEIIRNNYGTPMMGVITILPKKDDPCKHHHRCDCDKKHDCDKKQECDRKHECNHWPRCHQRSWC